MGYYEEALRQKPDVVQKYDKSGIYSISINEKLVYIGKSKNMLRRVAEHMTQIVKGKESHKYSILHQARERGYTIQFDVLEYCHEWELDMAEGEYIRKYRPPLNYQIPKRNGGYVIQRKAKWITLKEIMEK